MLKKGVKIWCKINGLAIIVGVTGGIGAIVFRKMIELFNNLFFRMILPHITFMIGGYNLGVVLLPALGGLIVGPIIKMIAPETKGHGVPEVMDAVHRQGGRIRARVAAVKILVSSITIGSGGSVGREGPIAQIGSTVGSFLGSTFKLSETYVKLLIVCGLAAGISGTFMAPLGGAIFGIEVIYRGVAPYDVIPVFLASVVGAAVTGEAFGLQPAFKTPAYTLSNPLELACFVPMGLVFGLLAILWTKCLYLFEDLFERLPGREELKPAIGGLMTGAIGVFLVRYGILGVGYEGIETVIAGGQPIWLLLILAFAKILATSLTLGSGGSGGIFAPSLYMGAMFGGALGPLLSGVPMASKQFYVYALVGMSALFAGAAKAPLTCIVMLPEMTDNYHLLPPLMLACAASYFVSTILMSGSIYTLKLRRRGVEIDTTVNPLKLVKVEEIMTPAEEVISVKKDAPLSVVSFMIWETKHTGFPVVEDGKLVGLITLKQLSHISPEKAEEILVKDVLIGDLVTAFPDETAYAVLEKMNRHDVEILPVVDREDRRRLRGIVSKRDTLDAFIEGKRKMRVLED